MYKGLHEEFSPKSSSEDTHRYLFTGTFNLLKAGLAEIRVTEPPVGIITGRWDRQKLANGNFTLYSNWANVGVVADAINILPGFQG